eukprot:5658940-Amphidinium_carterae.1
MDESCQCNLAGHRQPKQEECDQTLLVRQLSEGKKAPKGIVHKETSFSCRAAFFLPKVGSADAKKQNEQ